MSKSSTKLIQDWEAAVPLVPSDASLYISLEEYFNTEYAAINMKLNNVDNLENTEETQEEQKRDDGIKCLKPPKSFPLSSVPDFLSWLASLELVVEKSQEDRLKYVLMK